jgi:hypothetical protein
MRSENNLAAAQPASSVRRDAGPAACLSPFVLDSTAYQQLPPSNTSWSRSTPSKNAWHYRNAGSRARSDASHRDREEQQAENNGGNRRAGDPSAFGIKWP